MSRAVVLALLLAGCARPASVVAPAGDERTPNVAPAGDTPAVPAAPAEASDVSGHLEHHETGEPLTNGIVILLCEGAESMERQPDQAGQFRFLAVPPVACTLRALSGNDNKTFPLGMSAAERGAVVLRLDPERKYRVEIAELPAEADVTKLPPRREEQRR